MFIDSISSQPESRVNQLLETLRKTYKIDLSRATPQQLKEVASKYQSIKSQIVSESEFNSYVNNPQYARAVLILEAVRLLIEIAPKRMNKRTSSSKTIQNEAGMIRNKSRNHIRLHEDEELQQAEAILAAKDLSDRLQKMAEDSAKMAVDDLMPLVDQMKDQFGIDRANAFNEVVKNTLQAVLDSIMKAKDETENAIITLQQGGTPAAQADMGAEPPAPGAQVPSPEEGGEQDFEATPARSGPPAEPLGRGMKEEPGLAEGKKGKIPPQFLANIKKKKGEAGKKVEEGAEERKQNRLWTMITDYENRAKATKNEIKKAHLLRMAQQYRDQLKTNDKSPIEESNYKCLECVTGMYEQDHMGQHVCNECGSTMVMEKWGTKMVTETTTDSAAAQFDPSMHDSIKRATPAELQQMAQRMGGSGAHAAHELQLLQRAQAELKSMKESRPHTRNNVALKEKTTDRQKSLAALAPPRDKVTKADVLKGRGVIEEGKCPSCKKKPCVCEAVKEDAPMNDKQQMANVKAKAAAALLNGGRDPETGKPVDKMAAQKIINMREAKKAKSPGAVATAQVKKMGKKYWDGEHLSKAGIAKRDEIIRAIEKSPKEESQIRKVNAIIESLQRQYQSLKNEFGAHKKQFKKQIQEGKQIDPLGTGHGLEGDAILEKLSLLKKQILEATNLRNKIVTTQKEKKTQIQEAHKEIKTFDTQLKNSPYGLVGIDSKNQKVTKFFESIEQRTMWIDYKNNSLSDVHLINPETINNAKSYLKNKIQKS